MAPIALLLRTVFEAILEVFLICFAGYILARKGILNKATQKQINRLNVSLFTPTLLFSKVAFFLSPAKLKELWIIPIFFTLVTVVSMVIAAVLGWMFRLKPSQRNFAIAASMFMNSNSLPIALMQSLVATVPTLKWDDDDSEDAMLGRALSYLVLYSTLGMVLRWSYGVHLLSRADPEGAELEQALLGDSSSDRYSDNLNEGVLIDIEDTDPAKMTNSPSLTSTHVNASPVNHHDDLDVVKKHIRPSDFASFPNSSANSAVNLSAVSSTTTLQVHHSHSTVEDDEVDDSDGPLYTSNNAGHHAVGRVRTVEMNSATKKWLRHYWSRIKKGFNVFNEFMTVPLWAALLSLIVALVPPLQHTLDVHLQPIKGALNASGACSIPLTLVVLGAYFYTPPEKKEDLPMTDEPTSGHSEDYDVQSDSSHMHLRHESSHSSIRSYFAGSLRSALRMSRFDRPKRREAVRRPGETRTVFTAVVARMFITPVVILPLMALAAKFDNPKIFDDPVFVVSNILLISSPPALTLAQITQAASGDAFERLISRTIFWAYCVVTPPATILYVVIGIIFAQF